MYILLKVYVITALNANNFVICVIMQRTVSIFRIELTQGCMNFSKTEVKRRIFWRLKRDVKQLHSGDPQLLVSRLQILVFSPGRPRSRELCTSEVTYLTVE